jgi:hypothetical protein
MTSAGEYAPFLDRLPHDIPALAKVAQGLVIHEHMAHGYGVTLSEADRASVHVRPASQLLARILERDGRRSTARDSPRTGCLATAGTSRS